MATSWVRHALRRLDSSLPDAGCWRLLPCRGLRSSAAACSVLGEDPLEVQRHADSRRLMVWTQYYELTRAQGSRGTEDQLLELQEKAEATPHHDRRAHVAGALHRQMEPLVQAMRAALEGLGDARAAERQAEAYYLEASGMTQAAKDRVAEGARLAKARAKVPGEGAARVPGAPGPGSVSPGSPEHRAGMGTWAEALFGALRSGPVVRPSTIQDEEAHNGLFWRGETAVPGQIVAFYPGVVYRPKWHSFIPGYPLISHGNPYLILRPDHSIVDGKVWGFGEGRPIPYSPVVVPPWFKRATEGVMPSSYERATAAGHDWAGVDLRNPWALGHFANHPPKGSLPTVLKVPIDFVIDSRDDAWKRAYYPFLMFSCEDPVEEAAKHRPTLRSALKLGFGMDERMEGKARQEDEMSWGEVGAQSSTLRVLGIALVANAFITDGQEIFLNYRYNPFLRRPSWYHPVDAEEEDRLWRTRGHRVVQ